MAQDAESESTKFYKLSVKSWDEKDVNFDVFRGYVLIIVNVASSCGLAESNYEGFVNLLKKYYRKGLRILLFPCNQYMNQEPNPIRKIHEDISKKSKDFDLFNKVDVRGCNIHPVFEHLINTENGKGGFFGNFIKWNFTKFLIDSKGRVIKRVPSMKVIVEDDEDLVRCMEEISQEMPDGNEE